MNNLAELTDIQFEKQFQQRSVDPSLFSHEAHLRLAWIHIHRYGVEKAITNVCTQLKSFVRSLGALEKYNETVTVASLKVVHHFMLKSETNNFQDFISENHQLKSDFKQLLGSHYTIDIFNSPVAREKFLEPELLPFD